MDTEELDRQLEGASETRQNEFKGPCKWHAPSMAKDILALANTCGGGTIIIGVEDATFELIGITQEQEDSFDFDVMRDEVGAFADPHVNFELHKVPNKQGKKFVIIKVHEFEEVPVICRKNAEKIWANTIYTRNRNRRWESAPVSNVTDLREILLLSVSKVIHNLKDFGILNESKFRDDKKFAEERGEL